MAPGGDQPREDRTAPPLSWYDTRPANVRTSRHGWRDHRRRYMLDGLACVSVSALFFSQASSETLFRADRDFYSRVPLGPATLLALMISIVGLGAAGFAGVQVTRRAQGPVARRLGAVAASAALIVALNFTRITYDVLGDWANAIGRPALLAAVALVLGASLGWPGPVLPVLRRAALVLAPVGALTLIHAFWMFFELAAGPVWRTVEPVPLKTAPPSLRRVVWVVFDELDQRTAFEVRPPGVELPELDRLRRESVYADAAHPPAAAPELSMPALITGRAVIAVAPMNPNDLELTFADGKTARWSTQPNVFSRARVYGYDAAVIGWGLPYSRVLGSSLGMADWRPSLAYEQTRGETVIEALRNQWESLVPALHVRRLFAERVAEIGDRALRTAADRRFGLVLLHLPLPHPPGIYDPSTGRLVRWRLEDAEAGSRDNLALVDRVVGDLRRGLDRARLLDVTWIVLSSDRASTSRPMDRRVPFLVRAPEGGHIAHVDDAFNTLATQELVLAILRGAIADTEAAATWLRNNPSAPPKDYTPLGRPIY